MTSILKYVLLSLFCFASLSFCVAAQKTSNAADSIAAVSAIQGKLYVPQIESMNAAKSKFSINYKGQNISVTASVKMKKDSAIQLSLFPFLGIEMVRVILRPDSVTIIDKNNRYYCVYDYGILKTKFGVEVTFSDVQALLMNAPLSALSNATGFKSADTGYEWSASFRDLQANYQYDKDFRLIKTNLQQPVSATTFSCTYSSFTPVNDITFPTQFVVEAVYNQKQTGFTLTLDKITFNAPINFSSVNLSDYNRVSLEQLIPF